ncbi:zinc-finger domain-containing protein [Thiobacter aerophilum]|uniref:Zinc-finger domain-containing protein n=1 Tax=Thiobacter aerophilum TaxID=3121275 RepID=A0ABV0EBN4_9BURK
MSDPTPTAEQDLATRRYVEVTADDLPLACPTDAVALWNAHPRVFLPIEDSGEARCPYCGTLYRLRGRPSHHA